MNLVSSFMETARCEGDRPAIVAPDGTTISFADLAQRSARLAAHWRNRGLQKGARVLVAMPPKDAFGTQGNAEIKVAGTDTVVFLMDVLGATKPLASAEGKEVAPAKGLLAVKVV